MTFIKKCVILILMLSYVSSTGVLPPTNPPWKPTWKLNLSSITMTCNSSGYSSPQRGSQFGIVSYDWSNAKDEWAKAQPMDCEERLLKQAEMTKKLNPETKVFVYRNVVKALPWFSSVRKILDDPNYSGFFLRFATNKSRNYHVPQCALENSSKCSVFYHDQEQTPQVPTISNPHPDGSCSKDGCNCGLNPCGEYIFDHRNASVKDWIIQNLILSDTGLGSPSVDGMFIDDYWCSNEICAMNPDVAGCPCGDPVQGPTEVDRYNQEDMGLTDQDVMDLTIAWNETMGAVQKAILLHGGYTWSLMLGQQNANAPPQQLSKETCAQQLREACSADSGWQLYTTLFGLKNTNGTVLTQLKEDVAFFLLARGNYSYFGWGTWGMGWPFNPEPAHGQLPPLPHGVPRPSLIDTDFGEPVDRICRETSNGVFKRRFSTGDVILDCNSFLASLPV